MRRSIRLPCLTYRCPSSPIYDVRSPTQRDAVLVVRKAGEKPLEYLKYTMTDVIITGVTSGGSGGGDNVTENVSIQFAKIKVEYKEQTQQGGVGATPSMTWDIAGNIKE